MGSAGVFEVDAQGNLKTLGNPDELFVRDVRLSFNNSLQLLTAHLSAAQ